MFTHLISRRYCLPVLALSLSAAALMAADPAWAKSIGVDVWNVPALNEELREANSESDLLDKSDESLMRRIEVKEALIRDLLDGRATLAEVTAQFHELNAPHPRYMEAIRVSFSGKTDQEKMARNVISFALPRAEPAKRAALECRLEAELQRMLAGSAGN